MVLRLQFRVDLFRCPVHDSDIRLYLAAQVDNLSHDVVILAAGQLAQVVVCGGFVAQGEGVLEVRLLRARCVVQDGGDVEVGLVVVLRHVVFGQVEGGAVGPLIRIARGCLGDVEGFVCVFAVFAVGIMAVEGAFCRVEQRQVFDGLSRGQQGGLGGNVAACDVLHLQVVLTEDGVRVSAVGVVEPEGAAHLDAGEDEVGLYGLRLGGGDVDGVRALVDHGQAVAFGRGEDEGGVFACAVAIAEDAIFQLLFGVGRVNLGHVGHDIYLVGARLDADVEGLVFVRQFVVAGAEVLHEGFAVAVRGGVGHEPE